MFVRKEQPFIESRSIAWEEVGDGVRRKVMAYGDRLMAVYVEFKKGSIGYLHRHNHLQITYIQSGSFEVQIDGKKQKLGGGDCYYIAENLEHGVVALEDSILIDFFTPARLDFLPSGAQTESAD